MDKHLYEHLENAKNDIRDEIKKRIEQRDKYSIQLTIILSAIVAITFSEKGFQKALLAAPLAAIYFTVLILYSYRVHGLLSRYLREMIEPNLARVVKSNPKLEWEHYYKTHAVPGIRKRFFITALWIVTLFSLVVLYFMHWSDQAFRVTLIIATVLYLGSCVAISFHFREG